MNVGGTSLLAAILVVVVITGEAQFWKLNTLSDRDLFIMDTRSSMASGICYKDVPFKFVDPLRKFKTISYCCTGYVQNTESMGMKCDPICTEDCTNGLCSAPDMCECYPGFERINERCEAL